RHTRFSRDWSSDVCSSDLSRMPSARAITFMTVGWLSHLSTALTLLPFPEPFPIHAARLRRRAELLEQLGAEGFFLDVVHKLSADGEGYRAGLLRHDDADGVGHFGCANACALPGAQLLADEMIFGKRQITTRRHDLRTPDDDRSVVQRGVGNEYVDEQFRAEMGLHLDAGVGIIAETGFPFENN